MICAIIVNIGLKVERFECQESGFCSDFISVRCNFHSILKCCETFQTDMIMFLLLNLLAQIQRNLLICFTKLLSLVFGPCVSQVPAIETDHVTATWGRRWDAAAACDAVSRRVATRRARVLPPPSSVPTPTWSRAGWVIPSTPSDVSSTLSQRLPYSTTTPALVPLPILVSMIYIIVWKVS